MVAVEKTRKWEEIQNQIEVPVGLTELEKEKFRDIINAVKGMLDDSLEVILGMSRSEAYRYTQLIVNAVKEADVKFIGGVQTPSYLSQQTENSSIQDPASELDFDQIFGKLTDFQQQKAKRYLDCVKTVFKLKEDLENPELSEKERGKIKLNTVLCNSADKVCSVEEMIKCINIEDPSVKDEMDAARFSESPQV